MKKVTINLYNIKELKKIARFKAINDHRDFLLSIYQDDDFDESFNMTYSKYKKELTTDYIVEEIEANDYLYFNDGTQANITQYTGKHEKSGITELKIFDEIINL